VRYDVKTLGDLGMDKDKWKIGEVGEEEVFREIPRRGERKKKNKNTKCIHWT
jgi:hypothetical protein